MNWLTWGNHKATNMYGGVKHVFVYSLLYYTQSAYLAQAWKDKALAIDKDLPEEDDQQQNAESRRREAEVPEEGIHPPPTGSKLWVRLGQAHA